MNKVKIDLGFCEIYYDKGDKSLNESIKFIKKAFNYNKEFFGLSNIPKFRIILLYSRKEFDKLWGRKTPQWVSAFAKKIRIVIFSLSIFEKETSWKKKDFYSTLVHEINHIFFTSLTKKIYQPIWLCEGLATYIQRNKKKPKKKPKIFYKILNESFNYKNPKYDMYHLFIYYLIRKYGKEKFIKLLKYYRKGKGIEKCSQEVYNKSLKELIKDANKF